jgi:hypothetical protein
MTQYPNPSPSPFFLLQQPSPSRLHGTDATKHTTQHKEVEPLDDAVVAAAKWVQNAVSDSNTSSSSLSNAIVGSDQYPLPPVQVAVTPTPVPPPNGNRSSVLSSSYTHIGAPLLNHSLDIISIF